MTVAIRPQMDFQDSPCGPRRKARIDPQRSFKFTDANVGFRIANETLPTKRTLCAAATGAVFRFIISKRTIDWQTSLVAF